MSRRPRLLLPALALLLLAAACGSDDPAVTSDAPTTSDAPSSSDATTTTAITTAPTEDTAEVPADRSPLAGLPEVEVIRLSSGAEVPLASLTRSGTPTLLWFWAPHCVFCRREAPELLAFADRHGGDIAVLGLGAQDSLDEAYDFLGDTGTDGLEMVWDRTGRTWVHFDVTNQPTVVLLDGDGDVLGTWFRDFDEDAIVAAATA